MDAETKTGEGLKIEYVPISAIKPYRRNSKLHPPEQIAEIAESIKTVGFRDPIGIWHEEIVEGHGRYLAAKQLRLKEVPVIRLDDMSDDERRAYTILHNKTAMDSGFDLKALNLELSEINLDLSGFDFSMTGRKRKKAENFTDREEEPLPRLQHNVFDNFDRDFWPEYAGEYGIPVMQRTNTTGTEFLRFCDWKETVDPSNVIAHFYYDDYKFIQAWKDPDLYVERLREFKAVVSPDFSLYTDFPLALQIMSCYRRQWVGAYWQSIGLDVIPDVIWGEPETFDFCFDGIPHGGTVAVSSMGVKNDKNWNGKQGSLFKRGYDEMLRRLEPETVLFYGNMIDGLGGNIIRIPSYYEQRRKELPNGKRK